jgi:peptide/nickel transport system substrate-binding protein
VRNENYWRGPNGITGEDLPYLDAIEAVVAVDIDSRANGLQSGEFDIMHTSNAETISELVEDDSLETVTSDLYGETNYIMLNVAQGTNAMTGAPIDPEGANADNPMLNVACRRALAHAIDLERLAEERGGGISQPANGPFPPGSRGYLEDSGYPAYDPDAAQSEMDTCLEELGTDSIEFDFNTTNDPFNVETNTLIISMWQEVFGDQVSANITPIEQGQYIGFALLGNFDVFAWRNHGGTDPDQQLLWWISASSAPIGSQALNFGRFSDEVIDENLITIRTNPDEEARTAAAEAINERFGEQVYNLWTTWTIWGISSAPYVNDQVLNTLPDGSAGVELAFAGRHQVNQIWCDEGNCE